MISTNLILFFNQSVCLPYYIMFFGYSLAKYSPPLYIKINTWKPDRAELNIHPLEVNNPPRGQVFCLMAGLGCHWLDWSRWDWIPGYDIRDISLAFHGFFPKIAVLQIFSFWMIVETSRNSRVATIYASCQHFPGGWWPMPMWFTGLFRCWCVRQPETLWSTMQGLQMSMPWFLCPWNPRLM